MTQYDKLVHDTAEKMARLSYSSFERSSPNLQAEYIMRMYTCAELAVAMKADGLQIGIDLAKDMFNQGVIDGDTDRLDFYIENLTNYKQSLGLTKPTDNEQ